MGLSIDKGLSVSHASFDADAALAFLDDLGIRFARSGSLAIEPAWDAAWIACMTRNPEHAALAEAALVRVITEMNRLTAQAQRPQRPLGGWIPGP